MVAGEENRGGIAVLFKDNLWIHAYDIKLFKDQIWFKLDNVINFLFGAIYIPPRDSPYFSYDSFAHIHEIALDPNISVVMIGDFNARINNLAMFDSPAHGITYSSTADTGVNANGRDLADLLIACDLKSLNHMNAGGESFNGKMTYKQSNTWISQLDWCIVL